MDVIFDWNLGNMIYNGLITLRLCGFPFAEIRSFQWAAVPRQSWGDMGAGLGISARAGVISAGRSDSGAMTMTFESF